MAAVMSERFIDLGNRKWKTARESIAVRWRTSAKGNPFTTFRGFVIVVCQFREGAHWRYMVKPEKEGTYNWEVYGKFNTADEAKESAIAALLTGKKEMPKPDETVATEEEAMTPLQGRKIIL